MIAGAGWATAAPQTARSRGAGSPGYGAPGHGSLVNSRAPRFAPKADKNPRS